jgi:glycosyl transferase family 25
MEQGLDKLIDSRYDGGVNGVVDAVFVLSVRSFTDRISHIQAELVRHGIEFTFIFDFDADDIPDDLIASRFAESDLMRPHQSLVLKHIRSWELMLESGLDRVLVLEDDAELAEDFASNFEVIMRGVAALPAGWMVYLGRGDNQHVGERGAQGLIPGGRLPAADALVFDREAARRRIAFLESSRIKRPADWLIRETDASVGIKHYWLRKPIVRQGSMNGRFVSSLDDKRRMRGRVYSWFRYRWDAWWKRLRSDLGLR